MYRRKILDRLGLWKLQGHEWGLLSIMNDTRDDTTETWGDVDVE